MTDQQDLIARAARVLPGGVLGSHRAAPGLEFVVRDARGPYLWDADGHKYTDYLLGSGPMLLGHAHPAVVEAVQRQVTHGTTFMLLNEPIIALAEEIVRAVPGAEQVRFMSSGSEATFFALRVARAFRQRDKIMKFEGGFHGTHDYALMSVSPRSPKAFPAAMADSAGIPHAISEDVLIAPYNDLATTEALIATHHDELADEIVTGFRLAYGGAQEYYGVVPDVAAFGKVLAGGFPLAAVAGRSDIMHHFDAALEGSPDYVWQAGTLNGNPVAAVAGLATLGELRKPGAYQKLFATGARLRDGLAALARKHGMPAQVSGEPPVFDIIFTDRPVVDYRATLTADRRRIALFNEECLKRGVVKAVNKIYVSLAHSDADVDETLGVFDAALAAVAARTT